MYGNWFLFFKFVSLFTKDKLRFIISLSFGSLQHLTRLFDGKKLKYNSWEQLWKIWYRFFAPSPFDSGSYFCCIFDFMWTYLILCSCLEGSCNLISLVVLNVTVVNLLYMFGNWVRIIIYLRWLLNTTWVESNWSSRPWSEWLRISSFYSAFYLTKTGPLMWFLFVSRRCMNIVGNYFDHYCKDELNDVFCVHV